MTKEKLVSLATTLVLLFAVGCKKEAEVTSEGGPTPEAAPVAQIDPATAAAVTGKVSFQGTPPRMPALRMDTEAACMKVHKEPVRSEEVVVNENRTLRYVLVYVKEGLGNVSFPTPSEPAVLDQKGCLYIPHVSAVQTGQEIHILNNDPTTHNIHPVPKNNREWNTSMPPGSENLVRSFPREEVAVPVKCNVHPWMKSYIGVFKHPFFAVTGPQGAFEIKGLPPGEYVIEAWHERYGTLQQKVTLAAKESKTVEFTFAGAGGN
ncbi:MAG: carboxypeptidase regulatory-like domain-containing protein [Acidobacteria bacterium]|nr:carboxypeptidase regulatory-like domain-containing protein [Acidobacteriota bacterium]